MFARQTGLLPRKNKVDAISVFQAGKEIRGSSVTKDVTASLRSVSPGIALCVCNPCRCNLNVPKGEMRPGIPSGWMPTGDMAKLLTLEEAGIILFGCNPRSDKAVAISTFHTGYSAGNEIPEFLASRCVDADMPKPPTDGIVFCSCYPWSGGLSVSFVEQLSTISEECVTVDMPEPPGYEPLSKHPTGAKMAEGALWSWLEL